MQANDSAMANQQQQQQQQYLFAIVGWKPEGHKPIIAGSKKK